MIKTVNLTANTVFAVEKLGGTNTRIVNRTAALLYAGKTDNIAKGQDNVLAIPSGKGDYLEGTKGAVYLLSEAGGEVQLEGTDSFRPFDNAAEEKGGTVTGNPVVIDNLQGGVPFPEIVVSGKNMIPYPYHTPNIHTTNGITFTVNNDKSITANGTATAQADYYIKTNLPIRKGRYTLSGCPEDGMIDNKVYYTIQAFGDTLYVSGNGILDTGSGAEIDAAEDFVIKRIMIRIAKDTVCDNVIFRPQLETGDAATAYEPPITGQELTVNVNGAEIAVTPDSNPYVVPDEIRQQDGLNVLTVSAGELTVSYSKTNPTLSRIYKSIDSLATAIVALGAEN